jgi:mRNA interferase MazF
MAMKRNIKSYKDLKQGDIISINLNPTKGHEQKGYRPCIILTQTNPYLNYMIGVAPITSNAREFPLHVELPEELDTYGKVLLDQHRMIDIETRGFQFKEEVPEAFLRTCTNLIQLLYN